MKGTNVTSGPVEYNEKIVQLAISVFVLLFDRMIFS
jgi:hypothetical protein